LAGEPLGARDPGEASADHDDVSCAVLAHGAARTVRPRGFGRHHPDGMKEAPAAFRTLDLWRRTTLRSPPDSGPPWRPRSRPADHGALLELVAPDVEGVLPLGT